MKSVLVYGRGNAADKFIEFMEGLDEYTIIGVTDSYVKPEEIGTQYQGFEIYDNKKVGSDEVDDVIICSVNYFEEMREQLKKQYPTNTNITTMHEFIIDMKEQEYPECKKNELYHYFMECEHNMLTKWFHYFEIYDRFFSKYRGKEIVFCEVGVYKGGSLQMWKKYFGDKATIIGIDIDEDCAKYAEENIIIEIGSQSDEQFWEYIKEKYPRIDILLDDGGHEMTMQKTTFDCMFSHIQNNGIYMCEDTHTSYWKEMGGGGKDSFVEYTKNFVDDINAFHSRTEELQVGYNTMNMAGVHFYDSIVVVEKRQRKIGPVSLWKERNKMAYIGCLK